VALIQRDTPLVAFSIAETKREPTSGGGMLYRTRSAHPVTSPPIE
jgi:hypothetical protein